MKAESLSILYELQDPPISQHQRVLLTFARLWRIVDQVRDHLIHHPNTTKGEMFSFSYCEELNDSKYI